MDWLYLDDTDITQQFEILREGILRDVFSQRASSAWQGMQPQRLTVSLLLPCMNGEAEEWLDFMQCQRQFWPTMTTRHASLVPIELGGFPTSGDSCSPSTYGTPSTLTGIRWTRSCTMPNLLATHVNFYGTTSLSRSTAKIHFRNVSTRVMMHGTLMLKWLTAPLLTSSQCMVRSMTAE